MDKIKFEEFHKDCIFSDDFTIKLFGGKKDQRALITCEVLDDGKKYAIFEYCTMMCIVDGKVDNSEMAILEIISNILGINVRDINLHITNTIKKIK